MAELTQEDRDNHGKLKEAFGKLNDNDDRIKPIALLVKNALVPELSNDTGELRKRVDIVDGYLKIRALLSPGKVGDIQAIKTLNEGLNRSLKVVEGEKLELTEDIESFSSDPLFLTFLDGLQSSDLKKWTEALLRDRDPNLTEEQVSLLIQAWGKAVQKFVEDARKKGEPGTQIDPGAPETFASFFSIHNELTRLYSRLADTETVQSSR